MTGLRRRLYRREEVSGDFGRRVCLVQDPRCFVEQLRPFMWRTGVVEDTVGDEVLVRFGDQEIMVPAEMLESGEG